MDLTIVASKISEKIKKGDIFDYQPYEDLYGIAREIQKSDVQGGTALLKWLSETIMERMAVLVGRDLSLGRKMVGLHRRVLLAAAPWDFDSYMLFVEWNREPKKKFWPPRRKTLLPIAEDMQALADDNLDLLAISLPPGAGKAVAFDTPILTRNGWKLHGDLTIQDEVVSPDGTFVKVIAIHSPCEMEYEVSFTNGETIICHGKHEWNVFNRHKQKYETIETEAMLNDYETDGTGRGHRYFYLLPDRQAVIGNEKVLPVNPYLLGAWLGDGRNKNPDICGSEADCDIIVKSIVDSGYEIAWKTAHKTTGVYYYGFRRLRQELQSVGMCHSRIRCDKHIPNEYYTASVEQRLELLAGLIDTDGTLRKDANVYAFTTSEEVLRDDFIKLIATFGWRSYVMRYEKGISSSGIRANKPYWKVSFNPTMYIPCRLERKQLRGFAEQRRIAIREIKPCRRGIMGNCITVEGGMYCVGKRMVPTHNSTLAIFYLTWLAGKFPDDPILTGSHSNSWIKGAYDECLRIMDARGDYLWCEVFPTVKVSSTNAKDCRIDLGKRKRFETLEFTSIGTGNAGLYRAATLLYCDDLISSLEVALSPDRLAKLWGIYNTDLRQRKIGDKCKELHIATRWATGDVISLLEQTYEGDERAKFIAIPALDENDESNFDYAYGVGFSTKFYHEQRDIMDDVNWRALYMQQPIDREGRLYDPDELRRYFELPDGEPDAIISVCDTKDRGSDDCVMPVAYRYGDNYYIEEILCDNGKPEVVDELLIQCLLRHKVQISCFESNSAGGRVAQTVQAGVKARGGITKIETRYTTQNKETKILANSPWVKEHCLFKDDTVSDKGYKRAITKLCGYSVSSRNKHDDVPDAFSQLALYAESMGGAKVQVIARPF